MTTKEVATRLHELCEQGQYVQAHQELYAPDATSTELNPQGVLNTVQGLAAMRQKSIQFNSMITERHGGSTGAPVVFGNNIFMEIGLDVTMRDSGRMNMHEMAHYEVNDGKIVSERFYY